jgi:hypothetical protein
MKKFLLLLTWVSVSTIAFSQDREQFLLKSKHQHNAALTLLIGGGALFAGSYIWALAQTHNDNVGWSDYDGPAIMLLTGVTAMLGSIPLFIASSRNKKKALTAYFRFDHNVPGLAFKFRL